MSEIKLFGRVFFLFIYYIRHTSNEYIIIIDIIVILFRLKFLGSILPILHIRKTQSIITLRHLIVSLRNIFYSI